MPDGALTRLAAHEMAVLLRAGEISSRELTAAHLATAETGNRALNAWLVIDHDGALAAADAADARLAAGRAGGTAALAALHPLCGVPVGLKDLITQRGAQLHGRLANPGRLRRPVRRPRHRAPPRCRRGDPGQAQHGRVRDGLVDRALRLRADLQPVGPGPGARRQLRRLGGRRRGVPRAAQPSAPTRAARSASPPPCAGSSASSRPTAGSAVRDRRLRQLARPGRPARPRHPRRGGAPPRRRRSRRARLHVGADPRARGAARPAGLGRRGCRRAPRRPPGPAPRVLRRRHGAGRRGPRPRGASPRSRRPAPRSSTSACPTPTTAWRPTTSWRRRRRRRTWPATTGSATATPCATATSWPTTWPAAAAASGPR